MVRNIKAITTATLVLAAVSALAASATARGPAPTTASQARGAVDEPERVKHVRGLMELRGNAGIEAADRMYMNAIRALMFDQPRAITSARLSVAKQFIQQVDLFEANVAAALELRRGELRRFEQQLAARHGKGSDSYRHALAKEVARVKPEIDLLLAKRGKSSNQRTAAQEEISRLEGKLQDLAIRREIYRPKSDHDGTVPEITWQDDPDGPHTLPDGSRQKNEGPPPEQQDKLLDWFDSFVTDSRPTHSR